MPIRHHRPDRWMVIINGGFILWQRIWTACSGQVDEDDRGVEITATYPIQQWLTNCLNQGALWQVKHGKWCPLSGFDALRVYQLATLIEAVPRILLSRCTVKMHQRPTLWPTHQKSSGYGKDLLQIHVSTTWVGRNHTRVRRYYTCGVTQIGEGSWMECF